MKKHIPIIIAVALPIIFIAILALAILLPTSKLKPVHDFVYTTANEYNEYYDMTYQGIIRFENQYELKDGKIVKIAIPKITENPMFKETARYDEAPKLYYYDVSEGTTREISFEDAQKISFDPGPSSPDGYIVAYDYGSNGIFEIFGSDSSSGYVISKGGVKKKLNGMSSDEYFRDMYNFKLIGWVTN